MARAHSAPFPELPTTRSVAVALVRCSTDGQEHSTDDQAAEIRRWCA